ncbi:MAG TPA: holo-ACP synthase [Actinomycetota bacterium]|nr:holo-ACP synthase [Actinomycetota bacterium]
MSLGVDVVDLARFRSLLARQPGLVARFFTEDERAHCEATSDPATHLAGTFAAKEAAMKALGLTPAPAWARRIGIRRDAAGKPRAFVEGRDAIPVSISHDGPVAVAIALSPATSSGPCRPS